MATTIITTKELAEILRIGRDKAYSLMKSSSFPSIKLGNRYIVTEQALIEWLTTNQYRKVAI